MSSSPNKERLILLKNTGKSKGTGLKRAGKKKLVQPSHLKIVDV